MTRRHFLIASLTTLATLLHLDVRKPRVVDHTDSTLPHIDFAEELSGHSRMPYHSRLVADFYGLHPSDLDLR